MNSCSAVFFFISYPHICEATETPCYLFFFFPLPGFMRCYKEILASVHSNNSVHVWGSEEPRLLLTFLDPWIIKMPLAMHSSCKLFLVLHLAPTSHFGRARSDQLRKVQIRCFLHKHLFPLSPLLLMPTLISPNQHALLKHSQTRSCKHGNKLRKFISQGVLITN